MAYKISPTLQGRLNRINKENLRIVIIHKLFYLFILGGQRQMCNWLEAIDCC